MSWCVIFGYISGGIVSGVRDLLSGIGFGVGVGTGFVLRCEP